MASDSREVKTYLAAREQARFNDNSKMRSELRFSALIKPFQHLLAVQRRAFLKKVSLSLLAMIVLTISASAQDRNEIAKLRLYLGVPEKTAIDLSKSRDFKIEQPVHVVINSGDDAAPATEVVRFIDETNRLGKLGHIEIVSDGSKADLFLIQYEVDGTRRRDMVNSMSMDPALGKGRTEFIEKTKVRGYIVARKADRLEMIVRFEREVVVSEPRRELRDAFARFLREHSKR